VTPEFVRRENEGIRHTPSKGIGHSIPNQKGIPCTYLIYRFLATNQELKYLTLCCDGFKTLAILREGLEALRESGWKHVSVRVT
jgi:hypothetical protein